MNLAWIGTVNIGLFLCFSFSRAQTVERVNDPMPIVSDVLATQKGCAGWSKDDAGKWNYLVHTIPYRSKDARLNSFETDRYVGVDNFYKLELRNAIIRNKKYPVLVIWREDGEYKYPLLQKGYTEFKSIRYFVFLDMPLVIDEFKQFNRAYSVKFNPLVAGECCFLQWPSDLKERLQESIQINIGKYISFDNSGIAKTNIDAISISFNLFVFPVQVNGEESVRFLFNYSARLPDNLGINFLRAGGVNSIKFHESIGSDISEFDKWYFECPRKEFLGFWTTKVT